MSVFDAEALLPGAMASVLCQEGIDFEIVVVDDGSTDGTAALLERFAADDARVRVIHQVNAGLTKALIRGCREARGQFIARQDVDDLSLPGRLRKQAELLSADPTLAMASSWVGCLGPGDEVLSEVRRPADPDEATQGLLENYEGAVHGSVMFRRSHYQKVGGYREEFYFAQDSDLWLRMGEVGRIAFVQEVLYMLRISEKSLSSRYARVQARLGELSHACQQARREGRGESTALEEARQLRPGLIPPAEADPDGAGGLWFLSRSLLSRGDRRGLAYARRYVRRRPFDPRGWASVASGALTAWARGASFPASGEDGTMRDGRRRVPPEA
jgi:glycosyltransferase involved in cell wall biosynthesis